MNEEKLITFGKNDCEIMERQVRYQGIFTLARYHLRHRVFKGGWSNELWYELLERKFAAAVLPYDPDLDRVVLIEQFRMGAISSPTTPWLLEIVAGVIEQGETPEQVALREAKEEADCDLLDLQPICHYFVSPGGSNEYNYLYCGRVNAQKAGGIFGLENEDEDIRAFTLSVPEALALVKEGKINTAPAIIALQWLALNHEWLKKLWLKK